MRVLLVDIDSLRPDHLGCYGYDRDTSPTIDRLAAAGVSFDRCYASDTPCMPSRSAVATARHGIKSGVVTHFGHGQWYDEPGEGHSEDPDRPLAFTRLSEEGINTASISGFSKRHLAYHFGASFRESIQPTASTGGEQVEDVTPVAEEWLEANATAEDWLLHVNYWDVHHPYNGIDDIVEGVRASGDGPGWIDQDVIDAQQGMTGVRSADLWPSEDHYREREIEDGIVDHGEWGMPVDITDESDVAHIVDGYDASIRKVDRAVERLLETLEAQGVREETAVIVTADHGDALGEHGIYAEHAFAHPPCQQVPMIVSWPGVTDDAAGAHIDGQIYQFDMLATLCDLAGLEVPAGWDADPFTEGLQEGAFEGRDRLVCGQGIYTFSRAVYEDDWVYIRLLHPGSLSVPGLYNQPDAPGNGLELLHDRSEDPGMTENLIAERPEKADELRAALDGWTTEMITTSDADGSDPLARMAVEAAPDLYTDPADLADLYRELGRSERQIEVVERGRTFTPGR
jgi:arylsulfatase A-like enzyme